MADGILSELGGPRTRELLTKLDAATPWQELAAVIRPLYRNTSARGGRPHVPAVVMLKITFLQRWFGLSDPAMEEAILDRLSFRRFLGLGAADGTVDHSTIAAFRKQLHEHGLASELFDRVNTHLESRGLMVKGGTAVDATIIEAPTGRPRKGPRKNDDLGSSKDKAATHTKKHGRVYHGYKAHVASDTHALITDYRLDTAKVHDLNHFDELVEDETVAAWADSAYRDQKRQQQLEARGVFYGVMHRRVRGQPELSQEQKRHNRFCAGFRGICEMPFAWMRRAGRKRTRYRGLRKTATDFGLWASSYNLWRSLTVRPA